MDIDQRHELTRQNQSDTFDQLLLEAIDEGLSKLGEAVKIFIYSNLQERFNIKKDEIPYKLNDFSNALGKIFGLGARNFEILILKKLYDKLEATFKSPEQPLSKWIVPDMTFTDYVSQLRESLETGKDAKIVIGVLFNEQEELQR